MLLPARPHPSVPGRDGGSEGTPTPLPPREPLLFEKPDDRWEVNDLRARNIERADELEARLREEIQKSFSHR